MRTSWLGILDQLTFMSKFNTDSNMTENYDWSFSGISHESGGLYRSVPDGGWYAPNVVRLAKNRKFLTWGERHPEWPWLSQRFPEPEMLEGFLGLAQGSETDIHKFARKWGVLGLCQHGLRAGIVRHPECDSCQDEFFGQPGKYLSGKFILKERIFDWRRLSNHFGNILSVAIELHQGELAENEDLEKLVDLLPEAEKKWRNRGEIVRSRTAQQSLVQSSIELLSLQSDLQILFSWNPYANPSLNIGGSLFGALVLQLMLVISKIDNLTLCSACGIPFLPKRSPNPNRRRYCSQCGQRAAWKDAKRDERKKR